MYFLGYHHLTHDSEDAFSAGARMCPWIFGLFDGLAVLWVAESGTQCEETGDCNEPKQTALGIM